MNNRRFLPHLILLSMAFSMPLAAQDAPAFVGKHESSSADKRAIENLLATYTKSVTDRNENAFSALLLSDTVPFTSTQELSAQGPAAQRPETRNYQGFRQSIFASGTRYEQHFYNVEIKQDGPLAQVSLDFVTKEVGTQAGGFGWKTLQLLKVQGQWKIASEFYTVYPLPKQSS